MSLVAGGAPEAMAMPIQSGSTTRNTTSDAMTSRIDVLFVCFING